MFQLLLPDLRAEGDQPFIFGRTTRFLTPMAHALRLTRTRVGSILRAAIAPCPANMARLLIAPTAHAPRLAN